jgi:hypothetical protein
MRLALDLCDGDDPLREVAWDGEEEQRWRRSSDGLDGQEAQEADVCIVLREKELRLVAADVVAGKGRERDAHGCGGGGGGVVVGQWTGGVPLCMPWSFISFLIFIFYLFWDLVFD